MRTPTLRSAASALLGFAAVAATAALPDSVIIVPQPGGDFATVDNQTDPFANCPKYATDSKSQILHHGGWVGKDDFHAEVRFALDGTKLIGRIDVIDDLVRVDSRTHKGDRISVRLATYTSGPVTAHDRNNPFDEIRLYPQPEKNACAVEINATDAAKLGKIEASLFRSLDGYTIILTVPTDNWDRKPSFGGQLRCQMVFFDADDKIDAAVDNHVLSLFPVPRGARNGEDSVRHFGQLKFVEKVWARLTADAVIFPGSDKAVYRANWGNLSNEPVTVDISARQAGTGAPPKSWQVAGEPRELAPGTAETNVAVELDLSALPKGKKYNFKSSVGRLFETSPHVLAYTGSLNYLPDEHGISAPPRGRDSAETSTADTIRAIAGGGSVLWQSGKYDGTGADQEIKIWPAGKLEINASATSADKVPFALFGGRDAVDGMNEPLVLNFDNSLKSKDALAPAALTGNRYNRALTKKTRLLLIGLAFDYVNADDLPEVVVRTTSKELVRQKLTAPPTDGAGSRHVYVLRVWLEDNNNKVEIENVAPFGPRVEIDFIALVGGGADLDFPAGASAIRFSGANSADIYNRQLASTLYFMRNFLVDSKGQAFSSLPGGRYGTATPEEVGLMLSELSHWGATDAAQRMLPAVDKAMQSADLGASTGQMTIASGLCQLWEYSGRDSQLLQRLWIPYVLRTINNMERELSTNPIGLPLSGGEFGVEGSRRGATIPMYAASVAALRNAIAVAKNSGYSQSATPIERTLSDLNRNFRRSLVVEDHDVQLSVAKPFPESWTIPSGPVIGLLSKGNLIYGRYEDRKPVLYNGNIRVFDTPYLFSSVAFMADGGLDLAGDFKEALAVSYEYQQAFSPLARQTTRRTYGVIDYKTIATHHWNTMVELQLDKLNVASRSIEQLVAATFDESTDIPVDRPVLPSASVSPYLPGEQVNLAADGSNLGMTGDEMNAMIGTQHLRLARMIAGIDDANPDRLTFTPRLPDNWSGVEASNWVVSHNANNNGNAKINYLYERQGPNRFSMELTASAPLKSVTVRLGPFDILTRTVRISGTGGNATVTPVKEGLYTWVTRTFDNVSELKISAQAR